LKERNNRDIVAAKTAEMTREILKNVKKMHKLARK
jgi:hypothetical protein